MIESYEKAVATLSNKAKQDDMGSVSDVESESECCKRPLGLPCHHMIIQRLSDDPVQPIPLEDINVQWHLDPVQPQDLVYDLENGLKPSARTILNPRFVRGKGRPRGALNKPKSLEATKSQNSTKRDPSLFEHVQAEADAAAGIKPKRLCGICKKPGHDRRNHEAYENGLKRSRFGKQQSKQ